MKLQFFFIGTLLFLCLAGIGEAGFLRKRLGSILKRVISDSNSTILSRHPELRAKFASIRANISQCYDPTVGDKKVADIFHQTLGDIAHIYFDSNLNSLENLSLKKIAKRVRTFIKNVRTVAKLVFECLAKEPSKRSRFGLTSISAFAQEEFFSLSKLAPIKKLGATNQNPRCSLEAREQLPPKFSWLEQGFKAPRIKTQSSTQWCAAFSTTSALEFAYLIKNKGQSAPEFSPQAAAACITGSVSRAMHVSRVTDHIKQHGIMLERDAPFNINEVTCKKSPKFNGLKLHDDCVHFPYPRSFLKEEDLMRMIYRNGPTAVLVDASHEQFRYHKNTIYDGPCNDNDYTHAVLAVGWDESTILIQNSWGDWWGDKGYFRLRRGKNKCGVLYHAASVILA